MTSPSYPTLLHLLFLPILSLSVFSSLFFLTLRLGTIKLWSLGIAVSQQTQYKIVQVREAQFQSLNVPKIVWWCNWRQTISGTFEAETACALLFQLHNDTFCMLHCLVWTYKMETRIKRLNHTPSCKNWLTPPLQKYIKNLQESNIHKLLAVGTGYNRLHRPYKVSHRRLWCESSIMS